MDLLNKYFSAGYEESRAKFRNKFPEIKKHWPSATLDAYPLKGIKNNIDSFTIDTITAIPEGGGKHGILITSGLHGAEGYTGTAVINMFINEFAPRLDPRETGLVLVHGINPWGMMHFRRTNENNVDLNRNFIIDWDSLDKGCNKNYKILNDFFNPKGPIESNNDSTFYNDLSYYMSEVGPEGIKEALTLGQYQFPKGIYYGGSVYEESTLFIIDLFQKCMECFSRISFLDIHTGYGPRGQLGLITSPFEEKTPDQIKKILDYPHVLEASDSDFYRLEGDIVDFAYRMFKNQGRIGDLFGTCLEFGTWGEDLAATVNFLKIFFDENRLYNYGATDSETAEKIKADFIEILYPGDKEWREGVLNTTRVAIKSILSWFAD